MKKDCVLLQAVKNTQYCQAGNCCNFDIHFMVSSSRGGSRIFYGEGSQVANSNMLALKCNVV